MTRIVQFRRHRRGLPQILGYSPQTLKQCGQFPLEKPNPCAYPEVPTPHINPVCKPPPRPPIVFSLDGLPPPSLVQETPQGKSILE